MAVYQINYDEVLETALLGVRRAYVFMGLGLNAADHPEMNDYSLKNHSGIVLVQDDLPLDTVDGFKKEFANWIISNGLREMVEAFGLSLDKLHTVLGWAEITKGRVTQEAAKKARNTFDSGGVSKKITLLQERYGIDCQIGDLLDSLVRARNCLSHRRGIVAPRDCNEDSRLTLKWLGFDVVVVDPAGEQKKIPVPVRTPVAFQKGGEVFASRTMHSCHFEVGTEIRLTPNHLGEISMAIIDEAKRLSELGAQALREMGLEVFDRPASGQENLS